jgi:hypothetical protein
LLPSLYLPHITGLSQEIKKLVFQGFNQAIDVEATTEDNPEQEDQLTDQKTNQQPSSSDEQSQQPFNPIEKIREWCFMCLLKFESFPNSEEIAEAWRRLTGQELTPDGLQILIEKLNLHLSK